MKKQVVRILVSLVLTAMSGSVPLAQTSVSTWSSLSRLPLVQAISNKDSAGRPTRFQDESGHEYQCAYDDRGRLLMVQGRDERSVARRTLLGYDSTDRLRMVQFPSGYMVFIDSTASGERIARDSRGNQISLAAASRAEIGAPAAAVQRQQLREAAQSVLALIEALRAKS